jgi:cytochrome c5
LPEATVVSIRLVVVAALSGTLLACGESGTSKGTAAQVPEFEDPGLRTGRSVWMTTCRNCHLTGVAGAPALADYAAWSPRIAKGRDALYASVLNGIGDGTTWRMPPKGGNAALSEQQVRQAVDFTLAAVAALRGDGPR